MTSDPTSNRKTFPTPWRIERGNSPIADTGDYDGVTSINAANGTEVLVVWNASDEQEEALEKIVLSVNASAPEPGDVSICKIAGDAEARFMLWLMKEIPAGTVISSPTWWSPRIFKAVLRAIEVQGQVRPSVVETKARCAKPDVHHPQCNCLERESRDAARYRFLRNPGNAIIYAKNRDAWGKNCSGHVRYDTAAELDAAIDSAMGPSAEETKPKPTIEGLERLLQAEDPTPVHIWPDGSVHDAPPPPEKATPEPRAPNQKCINGCGRPRVPLAQYCAECIPMGDR